MIISGFDQLEISAMCSDFIYVGVAERESGHTLVVYNISYMLANKVWRNITICQIRQTLVPPNFRRSRYLLSFILLLLTFSHVVGFCLEYLNGVITFPPIHTQSKN